MKKQHKPFLSNKWILILKVATACVLLFIVAFFFFQNIHTFWDDLSGKNNWYVSLIAVFFLLALKGVCAYIVFLLIRVDDGRTYRADRFDIPYRIVYSFLILYIGIRSFFIAPLLNVPIPIIVIGLVFGVFNWIIPRLYYHDSEEF